MTHILYLIASHSKPEQLHRLVKTLKANDSKAQILIHHDYSKSYLDPALFQQIQDVHIVENPVVVRWGEFSVVELELRCFDWLTKHSIQFDWLVLLSGQDYPIQPLQNLRGFLEKTEFDGFIESFLAESPPDSVWNWGKGLGVERYYYRYNTVPSQLKWIFRKLYRFVNWQPLFRVKGGKFGAKIAIRRRSTPFNNQFKCYAGSQWHILNHRCVQHIQSYVKKHPDFVEYYRSTMIPDESFFQTILLNSPCLNICSDNLRYIVWEPPYPAILQSKDFEAMTTSGKFFARKFDVTVDANILDRLDQHLSVTPHPSNTL